MGYKIKKFLNNDYTAQSHHGPVIFESKKTDSDPKIAVEEAVAAGVNLTESDLRGLDLRNGNFAKGLFRSAKFEGARLDMANFKEADLERTHLARVCGYRTCFDEACLYGAYMSFSSFIYGSFKKANMAYAISERCDYYSASFIGANLHGVEFTASEMKGSRFANANVYAVNFTRADISGCSFSEANRVDSLRLEGALIDDDVDGLEDYLFQIVGKDYPIIVFKDKLQIGCQKHTYEEWPKVADDVADECGINKDNFEDYKRLFDMIKVVIGK